MWAHQQQIQQFMLIMFIFITNKKNKNEKN